MRRLTFLLALLVASVLVVPGGAALAAKPKPARPNAWLSYFPAAGVSCTLTATDPQDGSTSTEVIKVLSKSSRRILVHETGSPTQALLLGPHGRMSQMFKSDVRSAGVLEHLSSVENFPSPASIVAHRSARGRTTMTMPLSPRDAKRLLTSGSTLTVTGVVHVVGLGSRALTLADPAATTVEAIGIRIRTTHMVLSRNVKPDFARFMKRFMGAVVNASETDWFARGRGPVLQQFSLFGTTVSAQQTGCN